MCISLLNIISVFIALIKFCTWDVQLNFDDNFYSSSYCNYMLINRVNHLFKSMKIIFLKRSQTQNKWEKTRFCLLEPQTQSLTFVIETLPWRVERNSCITLVRSGKNMKINSSYAKFLLISGLHQIIINFRGFWKLSLNIQSSHKDVKYCTLHFVSGIYKTFVSSGCLVCIHPTFSGLDFLLMLMNPHKIFDAQFCTWWDESTF